MSQYDANSLRDFLTQTPEKGLRQILLDGARFSEVHLNLLLKIVRSCNPEEFIQHFEKEDFPKVKMSSAESKLKEKFWGDCVKILAERGILQPKVAVKEAA